MRIQQLSQRLKRIEGNRNGSAIKVELSDGDSVAIKQSQIIRFGANALFQPHSEEHRIVLNAVSHTEENGRMFELLSMTLCGEDELLTSDEQATVGING